FSPDVVDPDGHAVCAPPGGDLTAGCTPGDTGAVRFHVEPLAFVVASPVDPQAQPLDGDVRILASAPVDTGSLANITVTPAPGGPLPAVHRGDPVGAAANPDPDPLDAGAAAEHPLHDRHPDHGDRPLSPVPAAAVAGRVHHRRDVTRVAVGLPAVRPRC